MNIRQAICNDFHGNDKRKAAKVATEDSDAADSPDGFSNGSGIPVGPRRSRRLIWISVTVLVIIAVTFASGLALGAILTKGQMSFQSPSSALTSTPTVTEDNNVISTATLAPSQSPTPEMTLTPKPKSTLPPLPRPTATPGVSWYLAVWPKKCNCSRNLQLTPEVSIWRTGSQYYVFVTTTPGAYIQFRMTDPDGITFTNNWEQAVANSAGHWSIRVTAPSGPGFALLQARTNKGGYADASVACMNN